MGWKFIISVLFISLVTLVSASEKTYRTYHLDRGSKVWISGTATIGSYECSTFEVKGRGEMSVTEISNPSLLYKKNVRISVSVKSIDCGNPMMNRDMYRALRADNDSLILYELEGSEILYDSSDVKRTIGVRTFGNLTVAGVTKKDTIDVEIEVLSHGVYRINGEKKLSMLDFKITPPSALWGIIKTHEELVVHFQLFATPFVQSLSTE